MKRPAHSPTVWLLFLTTVAAVIAAPLLTACTADDAPDTRRTTVELRPCAAPYTAATTRAWEPPTGYYLFSDEAMGHFSGQADLTHADIGAFFTNDGEEPVESSFYYNADDRWMSSSELTATGCYIYAFIPNNEVASATIAPNTSYSSGATLTLRGLNSITPSDVCVSIATKEGIDADHDNGIQRGQFLYRPRSADHHYVFVLFDHLYSALRLRFRVNDTYNALRTIRLKRLTLKGFSGDTPSLKKTDAVIQLGATTDGTSPIQRVTLTPVAGSGTADEPIFNGGDDNPLTLSTEWSDFRGCFTPGGCDRFELTSTYDVYDKNVSDDHPEGNLIRRNCTATNTISLERIFGQLVTTTRQGYMYTINLTVNPTYLYMLSDPDLDSPTLTIENDENP